MRNHELKTTADTKAHGSRQVVNRQAEENILSPQRDPLARVISQAGDPSSASGHASLLSRAIGFRPSHAAHSLLQLQRHYGNHYVQRVLALARKADGDAEAAPEVEESIQRLHGSGQPLDSRVRPQMEAAFGADFSGVRVHTGVEADILSHVLGARAFTTGKDIFFRHGEYNPASVTGRELLAHELTHVVQQTGRGVRRKLKVSQPGDREELEADRVAKAVVQSEQAMATSQPGRGQINRQTEGEEEEEEEQGSVAFAREKYRPGTQIGDVLSAHELAHTMMPSTTSGTMVSRNGDGGPGGGGPGGGAPGRRGGAPAPAPAAPSVSIAEVNAPGTPPAVKRIPPRVDTNVAVTVTGWNASTPPVTLSIDGASATNGTATINGGATHNLTSTETVKLKGATQTTPGNAGKLKLVAHQGATKLADSNAFSVAAFPKEIGFRFNRIMRDETLPGVAGRFWGAAYDLTFVSDSGVGGDCDKTKISENILVDTATGIWAGVTPFTSGFLTTTDPQRDHHAAGAANAADMRSAIDGDPSSVAVLHQFFRFADERSGIAEDKAAGPKVPTSGFKISHRLSVISGGCFGSTRRFVHAKKEGFANNGVAAGTVDDTGEKDAEV